MTTSGTPSTDDLLGALHRSHDRFAAAIDALSDAELAGPSYDDEWSIGQVASHLGSGAEIFTQVVEAGRRGVDAPGPESFQPIWEVWNAKSAAEQGRDALVADARFLAGVDALTPDERSSWELDLFGEQRGLADLLRMRLGEHALHTWDITVMADASSTVPADAAGYVIGGVGMIVGHAGKGTPEPVTVGVTTTEPDLTLTLGLTTDGASIDFDASSSEASLSLPGEALIRLIYGRLDPSHTPAGIETDGITLDTLRAVFPGV